MNLVLQKIFSTLYSPLLTQNHTDGASSEMGTRNLRDQIDKLFQRYDVKSIFDAGCNDCNWMKLVAQYVQYKGGDISLAMVANVWKEHPEMDVVLHDVTSDPIPAADLLFVRDVAIHLNNQDKRRLWENWFDSHVPWILITHNREVAENTDFQYGPQFPFASANWELDPWKFPVPLDSVDEYGPGSRCMGLWRRDQFKGIL